MVLNFKYVELQVATKNEEKQDKHVVSKNTWKLRIWYLSVRTVQLTCTVGLWPSVVVATNDAVVCCRQLNLACL